MIYEKYPKYTEGANFFKVNGSEIIRGKTIEENNIKNNDKITLVINN